MNQPPTIEDHLESLGAALRERSSVADRVMDEFRQQAESSRADDIPPSAASLDQSRPSIRPRRRILWAIAGTIATIGLAVAFAVTLFPSPAVGWADVTTAMKEQKWIRGTLKFANGKQSTMWVSRERQVWAMRGVNTARYLDGKERVKYEYKFNGVSHVITKLPLGDNELLRIMPVEVLSNGENIVGTFLNGTEKVIQQKRREVIEDGKTWVEFEMVLEDGYADQAILRVDPDTRLPVSLVTSRKRNFWTKTESSRWEFDYPMEGPSDIYGLGVPRESQVENRIPSPELLQVVAEMAASRARIGDFRMTVAEHYHHGKFGPYYTGYVVSRRGNRWRVEKSYQYAPDGSVLASLSASNWKAELEERLKQQPLRPAMVSDGKSVWENSRVNHPGTEALWKRSQTTIPQDLMGRGSHELSPQRSLNLLDMLYPETFFSEYGNYELDSAPVEVPGCVLLKIFYQVACPLGHKKFSHTWYYIDPRRGYAVVRAEFFDLDEHHQQYPGEVRQVMIMEDFQQSPQGFWYPTLIRDTPRYSEGRTLFGPEPEQKTGEATIRYHFDFDAELPDSLFTIEKQPAATP